MTETSQRTDARRRQLLDAAVAVMQRTGYHEMSMQALAAEADVSVGLFYSYFGGKQEILLAAILDILAAIRDQLEPAMNAAGDDPIERLAAGFTRYLHVVDANIDAVVLTYRESRTLDPAGREEIKELEIETSSAMRRALDAAMADGTIRAVDTDLVTYDLVMLAHGWALKRWHFAAHYTPDRYARAQLALILRGLVIPTRRRRYQHLLDPRP